MARPRMSDAQIAMLDPEKRRETLKKRAQREKHAILNGRALVASVNVTQMPRRAVPPPVDEVIKGIQEDDARTREMYQALRAKFQTAGRWNDEGMHGMLVTYCQCVVEVERDGVANVQPTIVAAVSKIYSLLRMEELPAGRAVKAGRFDGEW